MKTFLFGLALASAGLGTAHAQVYVPQNVAAGSVIGGIAGAIIGGHNNDRWGEGAIIGAVAGGLIGAAVQPREPAPSSYYQPAPIAQAPMVPAAPVYNNYGYSESGYSYTPAPAPQPQVIYVERPSAPQVVYVERPAPPRVVYVERPVQVVRVVRAPVVVYAGDYRNDRDYRRGPPPRVVQPPRGRR